MRLKWKAWRDHKKNIKKEPKQNSRENRKKSRKAVFLFLLLLLAAGLLFWKAAAKRERTAAAAKGQKTSQVTKGTLVSTLSSSGTISPKDTYSITSLVEGEVLSAESVSYTHLGAASDSLPDCSQQSEPCPFVTEAVSYWTNDVLASPHGFPASGSNRKCPV